MSFRTRLTLFFGLIVIVPMVALGVMGARLIGDSERGKADARASAQLTSAVTLYERSAARGLKAARVVGSDRALAEALRRGDQPAAAARGRQLVRQLGLARLVVARAGAERSDRIDGGAPPAPSAAPAPSAPSGGTRTSAHAPAARPRQTVQRAQPGQPARPRQPASRRAATSPVSPLLDLGTPSAVAAGTARVRASGLTVEASILSASEYAWAIRSPGTDVVVRRGAATLASTLPPAQTKAIPENASGRTAGDGRDWIAGSFRAADFGGARDIVTILTDGGSTNAAVARKKRLTAALLVLFLALALGGALLVSRQLQGQIGRFLAAARRVGGGDLSSRVPVEGRDEFAALGTEFNKMSAELERRIGDLRRERGRLRDSIQRVGESFASNLDRRALLALGTETAVEAVEADGGRATTEDGETVTVGDLAPLTAALEAAEVRARATGAPAESTVGEVSALASPIPRARERTEPQGMLAVARRGRPFDEEEPALLHSLIAQTGSSLENVELHDRVARQAVTDELTGLVNHRRFQEVMAAEVAASHRYDRPLGLLMVDVDDFKSVNDTYGHQQGDLVLKAVAAVVQESCREIDEPARYGGEEMAVALPQTDLEGAFAIAERVRAAVEALAVPRLDGAGVLRVTVSCGVAASSRAGKDQLVAAADAALYTAKRTGKNRTVRGGDPGAATAASEAAPAAEPEPAAE
jgi:diguanylate cyclase (GGDEF)-like protein